MHSFRSPGVCLLQPGCRITFASNCCQQQPAVWLCLPLTADAPSPHQSTSHILAHPLSPALSYSLPQGGQFMRAVAERCQHVGPKMHTLVTMGAQHQGVANVPGCWEPGGGGAPSASFYCRTMQVCVIVEGSWFGLGGEPCGGNGNAGGCGVVCALGS